MPATALTPCTVNNAGKPDFVTKLTTPSVRFTPQLFGFAAASPQVTADGVRTSSWIKLHPGMMLNLTLTVFALAGALDIEIQEAESITDETEPVTLTSQFQQAPPVTSGAVPFTSKIVCPTKGYVRIVATPAAGTTAVWSISGSGRSPGRSVNF